MNKSKGWLPNLNWNKNEEMYKPVEFCFLVSKYLCICSIEIRTVLANSPPDEILSKCYLCALPRTLCLIQFDFREIANLVSEEFWADEWKTPIRGNYLFITQKGKQKLQGFHFTPFTFRNQVGENCQIC